MVVSGEVGSLVAARRSRRPPGSASIGLAGMAERYREIWPRASSSVSSSTTPSSWVETTSSRMLPVASTTWRMNASWALIAALMVSASGTISVSLVRKYDRSPIVMRFAIVVLLRLGGRCRIAEVEPGSVGNGGRFATTGDPELGDDVGHVHAGGLGADVQRLRDLPVRLPGAQMPEHLTLPGRQAERVVVWRLGHGGRVRRRFGQGEPAATGQADRLGRERFGAEFGGDRVRTAQRRHRIGVAGTLQCRLGLPPVRVRGGIAAAEALPGGRDPGPVARCGVTLEPAVLGPGEHPGRRRFRQERLLRRTFHPAAY